MTTITLLPTGTPASPLLRPGSTCCPPTWKLSRCPAASCADGHEASNTLPVRQLTPTYCVTTVSPLASFGPEPLIRVVTDSLAGGVFFGTEMTGAWPVVAVTDGSLPPPADTCVPLAACVAEYCCRRSITQTRVSFPVIWSCDWPFGP